jgi:predicted nucleic acid-binding protein
MDATLLDTDILSEILKQQNAAVNAKATSYLEEHGQFIFSAFTRFEIRRGFLERQANQQLDRFEEFCRHSTVLPVTDAVFDQAGTLWAIARQEGHPCGDADLIIAATAQIFKLTLGTGNLRHFAWAPNLTLNNWRNA